MELHNELFANLALLYFQKGIIVDDWEGNTVNIQLQGGSTSPNDRRDNRETES